jgi:hypothetical protein
MGLRFRKSVSLGKGLRLNFGKKGMSITTGIRGAHVTYSTSGKKTTSFGIPGTGISYVKSKKVGRSLRNGFGFGTAVRPSNDNAPMQPTNSNHKKRGCATAAVITVAVTVFLSVIAYAFGGNDSSSSSALSSMDFPSILTSSSEPALSSFVSSNTPISSVDSSEVSSSASSSAKASSAGKTSTAEPAKKEEKIPAQKAAATGITITQSPGTVQAGSNATLSIKGKPNTKYSIEVYYSTKASEAKGLSPQVSDSSGNVS